MGFARAQKIQIWPVDADELLLPRGFHNDRKDRESDVEEGVFEKTEDALDEFETCCRGSALLAGMSFGGV